MIITTMSSVGTAQTSMPVSDMQQCRKNMVSYVEEMPDLAIRRKTSDAVIGEGTFNGRDITFYVKCQPRNKDQ